MPEHLTDTITWYAREDWGARDWRGFADQGWDAHEVFVHHTDDTATWLDSFQDQCARMHGYQDYHMDVKGWDDIGYHAVVFPDFKAGDGSTIPARVFQGRPRDHVPAAQLNHNTGTLAIAVVAAADARMTRNQRYAVGIYIKHLMGAGSPLRTLGGHRDVTSTSCPGNGIYSLDLGLIRDATNLRVYKGS